jgi:hypothetical protein
MAVHPHITLSRFAGPAHGAGDPSVRFHTVGARIALILVTLARRRSAAHSAHRALVPRGPWHRPRGRRSGKVRREDVVSSRGSVPNCIPPRQEKPLPSPRCALLASIACNDQMLGYRRGPDRQSQGPKQPQRLRRPHGNPAAQHPRASDHIVHSASPPAPHTNASWSIRRAHALIQINGFINTGVRPP